MPKQRPLSILIVDPRERSSLIALLTQILEEHSVNHVLIKQLDTRGAEQLFERDHVFDLVLIYTEAPYMGAPPETTKFIPTPSWCLARNIRKQWGYQWTHNAIPILFYGPAANEEEFRKRLVETDAPFLQEGNFQYHYISETDTGNIIAFLQRECTI